MRYSFVSNPVKVCTNSLYSRHRFFSRAVPEIVATNKSRTSADIFSGVLHAVQQVLQKTEVTAAMVGTTHFINALIQRRNLSKVCVIRLCGPATHSVPPMSNWPDDLRGQVNASIAKKRFEFLTFRSLRLRV